MKGNLPVVCMVGMLSGYHRVPLAEESWDITMFITLYGHYRFKRQSMGMKNAGDVLYQAMDSIIKKTWDELQEKMGGRFKSVDNVLL